MDMIDLNLENGDEKVCPDDLMEAQTMIVEEDGSLGSIDDQSADTLLDTVGDGDDDELPYQFRSNEGVTYRVVQVNGTNLSHDSEPPPLSHIITASPTLTSPQQTIPTVFTSPLNGQLYVIGSADDVYPKSNSHKPIAPRTTSVINNIRNTGISKRDDRRRATHNEVERRRRDKINNWIMKLGKIVPDCNNSDSSKGYDAQSKGGILVKACDYILELSESNQKLMKVLKENEELVAEAEKLRDHNEKLLQENNEFKMFLKQNGLIVRYQKK